MGMLPRVERVPFGSAASRYLFSAVVLLVSVAGLSLVVDAQESPRPRTDDATLAAVVEYIDEQRIKLGVPGMAVAVVVGDEVRIATGLGNDSKDRPVTSDTVFLINSLAKSVTATALMQLVDAGMVDLDESVSAYVPELSANGAAVTVRDVMHHRSGVTEELSPHTDQHDLETNTRLAPDLEDGAEFSYTNANYDLLALVVERVSGVPFADYVEEEVFGPLSMSRSAVGTDRAQAFDPGDGHYKWLFLGYQPLDIPVDHGQVGSAAMYSTANDFANYLIAHLNNGTFGATRLVSEEGIAALHQERPYDRETVLGYGGGLRVEPADAFDIPAALASHKTVWHDGSSDTFRSVMWMTLGPDIGMVILANGNDVINESWIGQLSYGTRLLISGEEPVDVVNNSDFLTKWSKHLYLALALVQAVFVLLVLPILRRLRRSESLTRRQWVVLAGATLVDVVAVVLVFVVTPAVAEVPLSTVMDLPDYRILITAILLLISWGVIRTVLTGWWLRKSYRHRSEPRTAGV